MKIQKFNEELQPTKKCICMVIEDKTVHYSGIFNTKVDMENWLINIVNETIIDRYEGDDDEPELVLTVDDAIEWFQDDFDIHYDDDTTSYNKVKLKYGVDVIISKNKFNL